MASLAVRKTTWNGLTARNRTILKHLGDILQLGSPAEFETPGTVRWFVFDDHRFKPVVIAYLGCVVANLSDIPGGYVLPELLDPETGLPNGELDRVQMRSDIRTFCENQARADPLVLPQDIVYSEGGNVWQETLDAQNTPAAVQMASGVPESWTAVDNG